MSKLIDTLTARRNELLGQMDSITATAEKRGDDKMLASEARAIGVIEDQIAQLDQRLEVLDKEERQRKLVVDARNKYGIGDGVVRSEPRVYDRGSGNSYFGDLARSVYADAGAQGRLARHAQEVNIEARYNPNSYEARAGLSTSGAGSTFVPPAYLVEEYVPFAREDRPFANACNVKDLPKGTDVINLPKVLTGTAVGPQATQNTAILETDLTDAYVTAPVVTVAGQQTVSLQWVEQSPIDVDEMIMSDLASAHAQQVDSQVISGSGTGGNLSGVLTMSGLPVNTYTDASPTGTKLYPWIAKTMSDIRTNRHAAATHVWMSPARWYWLASQTDSNGRPLVVPAVQGPWNTMASMSDKPPLYEPAGTFLGAVVYLDANLPTNLGAGTNQDVVITAKMDDLYLYESAPVTRALPQTLGNQLSVLIQLYSYEAFLPQRYPASVSVVEGTGLVTPAF